MLIYTVIFISCSSKEVLDIDYLKKSGYEEVTCRSVESYQAQETNFIEINKKLSKRETYLLARCFDKDNCLLNINLQSDKIVCQRYIVSIEEEYKKDYEYNDFKEFADHLVLYILVDEESIKEFITRAN